MKVATTGGRGRISSLHVCLPVRHCPVETAIKTKQVFDSCFSHRSNIRLSLSLGIWVQRYVDGKAFCMKWKVTFAFLRWTHAVICHSEGFLTSRNTHGSYSSACCDLKMHVVLIFSRLGFFFIPSSTKSISSFLSATVLFLSERGSFVHPTPVDPNRSRHVLPRISTYPWGKSGKHSPKCGVTI